MCPSADTQSNGSPPESIVSTVDPNTSKARRRLNLILILATVILLIITTAVGLAVGVLSFLAVRPEAVACALGASIGCVLLALKSFSEAAVRHDLVVTVDKRGKAIVYSAGHRNDRILRIAFSDIAKVRYSDSHVTVTGQMGSVTITSHMTNFLAAREALIAACPNAKRGLPYVPRVMAAVIGGILVVAVWAYLRFGLS